jgi:hypothetical protein
VTRRALQGVVDNVENIIKKETLGLVTTKEQVYIALSYVR